MFLLHACNGVHKKKAQANNYLNIGKGTYLIIFSAFHPIVPNHGFPFYKLTRPGNILWAWDFNRNSTIRFRI
jgi:hypothetical protein